MHLSAKDIQELEAKTLIHFLNPSAIRRSKSLGDAVGLINIGIHLVVIEPGCFSTELHAHRYEEECVYVLSGEGRATIGEERYRVGPGDFIGCPTNGVAHDMFNDTSEPLVYLVIGQRLNQDVVDYPRKKKRLFRNNGDKAVVDYTNIEPVKK